MLQTVTKVLTSPVAKQLAVTAAKTAIICGITIGSIAVASNRMTKNYMAAMGKMFNPEQK